MAINQLALGYLLHVLRQSLHSVDLRAALVRSGSSEFPLFIGMRLAARSPEEVVQHHAALDARMVGRDTPRVRIVWEALPFENVDWILHQLSLGVLQIAGRELQFSKPISAEGLSGRIARNHLYVRVWDRSPSAAYFAAATLESEKLSALWNDPDILLAVQHASGLDLDQLVDAFVEITSPSRLAINFFCYVEMPGWIERISLEEESIEVFAEHHLSNLRLLAAVSDPIQGPLENRPISLEEISRDSKYRQLRGALSFDVIPAQGVASCVLNCDGLAEIDSVKIRLDEEATQRDVLAAQTSAMEMRPVPAPNPYNVLSQAIHSLIAAADKITIHSGSGSGNSGISALIPSFNSFLDQTRKLLANDPGGVEMIAHIDPIKPLQERLDASYHRTTRQRILVDGPSLLHALAPYVMPPPERAQPTSNDIFIVHGRDDGMKNTVARFIEKVGLKVVILHELPNQGRTVIEKFIGHSDVGFAVVLFSPDDRGGLADQDPSGYNGRARQNVMLELGYFLGRIGRARVCVLYQEGVEIPSDYHGVLFIRFDPHGAWRQILAREIKAAGIELDLNRA
jgi:predicted nucleotide-binding protein with TIR-like domain